MKLVCMLKTDSSLTKATYQLIRLAIISLAELEPNYGKRAAGIYPSEFKILHFEW